jgi:hypothetical protein
VDETPHIRLSVASLELADGTQFDQYVMRLPRCAMTVVLDDAAERVLLIWRHRFIIDRWLWELPGLIATGQIVGAATIIGAQHALLTAAQRAR